MLRGLYTASAGMESALQKNNTISNNLANINTTGYKKQTTINKAFPEEVLKRIDSNSKAIGTIGGGTTVDEISTDQTTGKYKRTGNDLDWALKGEGFFVVQTPKGERYTRNGNFTINNQGQVVTQQGYPVRGEGGFLQVPDQAKINVENNNLIVDGETAGTIRVRSFADKSGLVKEGATLFRRTPEVGNQFRATGIVKQGFLEGSNVNPVEEMTKMIQNSRKYEADQKMVKINDNTLKQAVNQVGKV